MWSYRMVWLNLRTQFWASKGVGKRHSMSHFDGMFGWVWMGLEHHLWNDYWRCFPPWQLSDWGFVLSPGIPATAPSQMSTEIHIDLLHSGGSALWSIGPKEADKTHKSCIMWWTPWNKPNSICNYLHLRVMTNTYIYMYMIIYVYVYMCIYVYIYTHTYIYI